MIADVFIRRPVLRPSARCSSSSPARSSIPTLPIARYPELAPPSVTVIGVLHRRQRAGGRERGDDAARAGDQRRRGDDLHHLVEHQQRRRDDHGDVRHRPRSRPGRGRRAEPRQPGARPHAGRGPHQRHHGHQEHRRLHRRARLLLARTTATRASSSATTSTSTSATRSSACPASATCIIFGERKFAMRLWLDPHEAGGAAASPPATSSSALREQNVQVAAGALGDAPAAADQMLHDQRPRDGPPDRSRRSSRTSSSRPARTARWCASSDVGRVELGAETYSSNLRFLGLEASGIGISAAAVGQRARGRSRA